MISMKTKIFGLKLKVNQMIIKWCYICLLYIFINNAVNVMWVISDVFMNTKKVYKYFNVNYVYT